MFVRGVARSLVAGLRQGARNHLQRQTTPAAAASAVAPGLRWHQLSTTAGGSQPIPGTAKDRVHWALQTSEDEPNVVRYDKWMSSYDKDVQEAGYILPLRAAEVLFEHLGDNTASVLDAGCGTGLIGGRLRELGFKGSVAGVDYSQGMLQACYDARGNSYTTLMVQDLNAPLPWLSGIFDAVICVGVLYPDQVREGALKEYARIVKPGGLVVTTFRKNVEKYATNEFVQRLEELEAEGYLELEHKTPDFHGMYIQEPEIEHNVFVHRVVKNPAMPQE